MLSKRGIDVTQTLNTNKKRRGHHS